MMKHATKVFLKNLPAGLDEMRDDLAKHFNATLTQLIDEHNMVTRELFDAQTAVLEKTRKKLDALEKKLELLMHKA